jgi:hypothetical protein
MSKITTNAGPDGETPEWARKVVNRALARLREEYVQDGKQKLFECLQGCLPGPSKKVSYEEASQTLGMEIEAVRMAVHRLRRQETAPPGS